MSPLCARQGRAEVSGPSRRPAALAVRWAPGAGARRGASGGRSSRNGGASPNWPKAPVFDSGVRDPTAQPSRKRGTSAQRVGPVASGAVHAGYQRRRAAEQWPRQGGVARRLAVRQRFQTLSAKAHEQRGRYCSRAMRTCSWRRACTHRLGVPLSRGLVDASATARCRSRSRKTCAGRRSYVIQPTPAPTAGNLVGAAGAAWTRSSAPPPPRPTAVIPCFGYARQDRRPRSARACRSRPRWRPTPSAPCMPKAASDISGRPDPGLLRRPGRQRLRLAGALADIWRHRGPTTSSWSVLTVGGVVREPSSPSAPGRCRPEHRQAPSRPAKPMMNIIGDVGTRPACLIDDIVDTPGTLCARRPALKRGPGESGATRTRCSRARRWQHRQLPSWMGWW